jgi:hypothetical protein
MMWQLGSRSLPSSLVLMLALRKTYLGPYQPNHIPCTTLAHTAARTPDNDPHFR